MARVWRPAVRATAGEGGVRGNPLTPALSQGEREPWSMGELVDLAEVYGSGVECGVAWVGGGYKPDAVAGAESRGGSMRWRWGWMRRFGSRLRGMRGIIVRG